MFWNGLHQQRQLSERWQSHQEKRKLSKWFRLFFLHTREQLLFFRTSAHSCLFVSTSSSSSDHQMKSVCILSGKIQVYNWAMISFKPSFFQVFLLWWILEAPLYHSKCHPAPLLKTICVFPLWRGDLKTRLTKHFGCRNEYKTFS